MTTSTFARTRKGLIHTSTVAVEPINSNYKDIVAEIMLKRLLNELGGLEDVGSKG